MRTEPYPDEELGAHDRKLAKYFLAGGGFLVLGGLHMVAKNLPWTAEWLARAGYAGHLVRDLSNTHVMIVGGGTLIATGLCWYVAAADRRAAARERRPRARRVLVHGSRAARLLRGLRRQRHRDRTAGRARLGLPGGEGRSMGNWYRVPVGIGAGVMGLGYWCFAANVFLTVFQARLVRVPKPSGHLWKFLATGAAGLTVGTVQGVIQVQPANADWLYRAGHAGEWIDPISHAHINLVTGLTMLVAGGALLRSPRCSAARRPRDALRTPASARCSAARSRSTAVALYLGLPRGAARRRPRADARAGGGGDDAPPVPDHGRRAWRCSPASGSCS